MTEVYSTAGMRSSEERAINEVGIASLILMENAAQRIADEIVDMVGKGKTALFVCGPGNNGGDGFSAARYHRQLGGKSIVVALTEESKGDARINREILKRMSIDINSGMPEGTGFDIAVDAMFGTGLRGELKGAYAEAARYINACGRPVLAVDIPSGVNGDTGGAAYAVKADRTITFHRPKLGHFLYPGRELSGRVVTRDIGIPGICGAQPSARIYENADLSKCALFSRKPNSYKGSFGHALIVAGSRGMAGAAVLSAKGALWGGAGLVTVGCCADSVAPIVQSNACEAMAYPLPETADGCISPEYDFSELVKGKAVIATGPGLRATERTYDVVKNLSGYGIPMVLDADALNAFAIYRGDIPEGSIITPHIGEMARLTGKASEAIIADPVGTAKEYAKAHKVTVLLKGSTTVVAEPGGGVALNTTGTPAMATGGSGDVLTGLVAAFMAQGLPAYESAAFAAFIHGRSGEAAENAHGSHSVTAGAIAAAIPYAIGGLRAFQID